VARSGLESTSAGLLGRERECAAVEQLLEAASHAASGSLVIRGQPGIGKTALLDYAAEHAAGAGIRVLRTAGVEAESELAFAGLHALVRPIVNKLGDLPETQAAALGAALGLAGAPTMDRFLVSVATLSLIAAAAEDGPLMCLIDDAQWLDAASADALVFTTRRLEAERVAMLFAAREGDAHAFAAPGLPELGLGGLSDDAAARLLSAAAAGAAGSVRAWLLAQAAGNPLAVLELPRGLSEAQLQGRAGLPEAIPLTSRLRSAFVQRIELLPAPTRAVLLLAAIDDEDTAATVLRAADGAGLPGDALDAAEDAGLVRVAEGEIVFRHPLVRSAVQGSATISQRRRAHAALAAALSDTQHADRRIWHRAQATLTADEEVAAALEASGRRSQQRAAHSSAATAFARAAELTADESRRIRWLAAAAEAAWAAGQPDRARELITRTLPLASGRARGELLYLRGVIEARTGDLRSAVAILVEAVDELETIKAVAAVDVGVIDAGSLVLEVLLEATASAAYAGDIDHTVVLSTRGAAVVPVTELDHYRVAALRAVAAYFAGQHERAAPLLADAILQAERLEDPRPLSWAADLAAMAGRADDRLRYATHGVEIAREQGLLSVLPLALQKQTSALISHGRFRVAYATAEEGIRLASDSDHRWGVSWNLANLTMLDALHGSETHAQAHAEEALELASLSGAAYLMDFITWALGLLDLTLGRPDEATDRLLALTAPDRPPVHPFVALGSIPDLIEAATRAGRREETLDRLARYEDWARRSPSPAGLSLLARCRALSDEGDERRHFETALTSTLGLSPFEQARTELLYGEWLRRQRAPREARAHLRKASDAFRQLATAPWEKRADAELRATGETARRRDPSTVDPLTPQELQIAGLVAAGMTNRQIAAQLYLSPRTIDYHLRKVFSKLEVASRTELVHIGVPPSESV
jgi:DNA-binding CsgD family transcriptional regulator